MNTYYDRSPDFIIGSSEITEATNYLQGCLRQRRSKLDVSEIDDTFNAILMSQKKSSSVVANPCFSSSLPSRRQSVIRKVPTCYARVRTSLSSREKTVPVKKQHEIVRDMTLSAIREHKFPAKIALTDNKVEAPKQRERKKRTSHGILYSDEEEPEQDDARSSIKDMQIPYEYTGGQKNAFNAKFRKLFSQRIYNIQEKPSVQPVSSPRAVQTHLFRRSRSQTIHKKSDIDCFIDQCANARKNTKRERKRMVKQFSNQLTTVLNGFKEKLDFSSKYKKQCVKEFRKSKKVFIYGKEFKGYFISDSSKIVN